MIYLSLTGGLGNQLFQYAYARNLSLKTNQEIILDLYTFSKDELRSYELNNFNIIAKIDNSFKVKKYNQEFNLLSRYYRKIFKEKADKYYLKNNIVIYLGFEYKEFLINKDKDIYLYGYFQSEKFFEDAKNIIKDELFINPNKKYNLLLNEIKDNPNSVCVHYRKGDYKLKKNYHYQICTTEYYIKAMECLSKKLKDPIFYIFSDDINEVKEEFRMYNKSNIKYVDNIDNMIDEFALMLHCNNFIISNSTFSWWGQYLCKNDKKIVIAPKRWNKFIDIRDIYQDNWICM